MKTYSNCICCNTELELIETITPSYDDGGGLDAFDVQLHYPTNPYCEGCEDNIPEECKELDWIDSFTSSKEEVEEDDLPF
jgi:hypothetical protein